MHVICPHCRQNLIDDGCRAGQNVTCPFCSGLFQMPIVHVQPQPAATRCTRRKTGIWAFDNGPLGLLACLVAATAALLILQCFFFAPQDRELRKAVQNFNAPQPPTQPAPSPKHTMPQPVWWRWQTTRAAQVDPTTLPPLHPFNLEIGQRGPFAGQDRGFVYDVTMIVNQYTMLLTPLERRDADRVAGPPFLLTAFSTLEFNAGDRLLMQLTYEVFESRACTLPNGESRAVNVVRPLRR